MKYKEGDKVRIRSKEWYDKHKDAHGEIRGAFFDKDRVKLCGTIQTIANKGFIDGLGMTIYAVEDAYEFIGEEAIEGLVEEETSIKGAPIWPIHWHNVDLSNEFECPDGYEFHDENGNVIAARKIVLEKKSRYPKSYSECCAIIGAQIRRSIFYTKKDKDDYPNEVKILSQLDDLRRLLICRDAYWKIAGEEMGLGKPWKPNWDKCSGIKYCIYPVLNGIRHDAMVNQEYENRILAFPTAEMRDAFYENFKELINECKELL